jgi:hypothetical protein
VPAVQCGRSTSSKQLNLTLFSASPFQDSEVNLADHNCTLNDLHEIRMYLLQSQD